MTLPAALPVQKELLDPLRLPREDPGEGDLALPGDLRVVHLMMKEDQGELALKWRELALEWR